MIILEIAETPGATTWTRLRLYDDLNEVPFALLTMVLKKGRWRLREDESLDDCDTDSIKGLYKEGRDYDYRSVDEVKTDILNFLRQKAQKAKMLGAALEQAADTIEKENLEGDDFNEAADKADDLIVQFTSSLHQPMPLMVMVEIYEEMNVDKS